MLYINKIIEKLKCNKGESTLISIVKFFIFFAIIGVAVEFFRLQAFQSTIQTKIEIIVQDALELSVDDRYRMDRLSIIDSAEAEMQLFDLLITDLNLDNNLSPMAGSVLQTPLVIESITIREGSFTGSGNNFYNLEYPSIRIRGHTHQRIILIPFLDESLRQIEIPFNVYIENRRYN
ncbi:hypothetical protein [Alkaliphilus peptidifermentans]|uniref:hypothetical protein n=1 Tax=Alkaliphilus peptidifermentans TaxID=426129 RepID=UPI000B875FBC|nr:hypothetical protein [Alkaliphilus peptidifermentans]